MVDYLIIGAGINGALIAHRLSKKDCSLMVIEKRSDVALGSSGANSAIVHSGHDPHEGTLKARFNVEGNRMYEALCRELKCEFKRVGAYVVSTCEEESLKVRTLYDQAISRGIDAKIVSGDEVRIHEPHVSDDVILGLWLPTTGIISPWEVTIAAMEEACLNGTDLHLNEEVLSISKENGFFTVKTDKGTYETKQVISCAGVYGDEIAHMIGNDSYHIRGRRGEYFVLAKDLGYVNSVIYPVPTAKGKGVLAVPTVHGNVLLGPNAEFVDDKKDTQTTAALDLLKRDLGKTLKDIPYAQIIHNYAGLRPTGDTGDFVIEEDKIVKGFIHVSCIESPGLASAPAIARYVCEDLLKAGQLCEKENYIRRERPVIFSKLSDDEKNELIRKDPDYGRIVCRCEGISAGEIKNAIHRVCGARTIDGVKKRCRPGMGKCQGGFCEPLVLKILADELGVDEMSICRKDPGSEILRGLAKEDL